MFSLFSSGLVVASPVILQTSIELPTKEEFRSQLNDQAWADVQQYALLLAGVALVSWLLRSIAGGS